MILGIGDLHFSEYSSIDRRRGLSKYSKREESLINTLNWIEETAEQRKVEKVVFFGDFFDKTELNASELTALQEVQWSSIPHIFIVGNHEGLTNDLSISSAHLLSLIPNAQVIDKPFIEYGENYHILYLPYILEQDRKPLAKYFDSVMVEELGDFNRIVFSHNDIKMRYGIYESTIGFDPQEIDTCCNLFLNAHIHNCGPISEVGYNIGNITGANFSEDAFEYGHFAYLIDPASASYTCIENPYALNFYKAELRTLAQAEHFLSRLKDNAIISLKVPQTIVSEVKMKISECPKVKESRVISIIETGGNENESEDMAVLETVNHLDEFVKFIQAALDYSDLVKEELAEVCK